MRSPGIGRRRRGSGGGAVIAFPAHPKAGRLHAAVISVPSKTARRYTPVHTSSVVTTLPRPLRWTNQDTTGRGHRRPPARAMHAPRAPADTRHHGRRRLRRRRRQIPDATGAETFNESPLPRPGSLLPAQDSLDASAPPAVEVPAQMQQWGVSASDATERVRCRRSRGSVASAAAAPSARRPAMARRRSRDRDSPPLRDRSAGQPAEESGCRKETARADRRCRSAT